jgi:acyl carrier protein
MEVQTNQIIYTTEVLIDSDIKNQDSQPKQQPTGLQIEVWLAEYIANLINIDPELIDVKTPFVRYGLDSLAAVGMTGDLQDWLGCKLEPTLPYSYPTIEALAQYLAEEC